MTVNTEDNVACGLPGQRGIAGPLRRWGTAAIREVMQRFFLFEFTQFAHRGNYLWGLGVVMDHKHFLRGKGGSYRGQVLWVFSARTGDIGGLSKKISTRSGELVAGMSRRLSPSRGLVGLRWRTVGAIEVSPTSCTNESDGFEIFNETNDALARFVASKARP